MQSELGVLRTVLVGGNITAAFTDRQIDLHLRSGRQTADHQIGIQHFEERKEVRDVTCRQLGYAGSTNLK